MLFSKIRQRLPESEIDVKFFEGILARAREKGLLSEEHFTVDGTLIEAWASQKSFQKKDQPRLPPDDDPVNPSVHFRGQKRMNDTHGLKTHPQARLWRKARGHEAKRASWAMRSWRTVTAPLSAAARASLRVAPSGRIAPDLIKSKARPDGRRITLKGDYNYDTAELVARLREINVTPHVAQNDTNRSSAIYDRTTCYAELRYQLAQAQACRGDLRLAQDDRASAQGQVPRSGPGRLGLPTRSRRAELCPHTQPHDGDSSVRCTNIGSRLSAGTSWRAASPQASPRPSSRRSLR